MAEWGTDSEGKRRVSWGEMRLVKLAPRDDAVFRDKTTVRAFSLQILFTTMVA